jgi:hypothetical protein
MVAVLLMLVLYTTAAWVIFWVVPRSLRRSKSEVPSTVPQGWVDEFRDVE